MERYTVQGDDMIHAQHTDMGPHSGPQTEARTGHHRHGAGPAGRCGRERFRAGGRGRGGSGGGQGDLGDLGDRGDPGGQGGQADHGGAKDTGSGRRRAPHGHGFGTGFGPHFGRGRGSRARRGDVRTAILLALADEPAHGYQIMQRLEERSGGAWRPSPGSVYPTLQLLQDQGLIRGEEAEGRRVFSLTEAGAAEAAAIRERVGDAPWETTGPQDPRMALRQAVHALGGAARQVALAGSADDAQKALEILREARRSIYALLADAE
jgi:DNA-binding PadR family transcriptional regulator